MVKIRWFLCQADLSVWLWINGYQLCWPCGGAGTGVLLAAGQNVGACRVVFNGLGGRCFEVTEEVL